MRVCKAFLVGMAIMVMVGLGGCCGGGTTVKEQPITTTTTTNTTTLGEELKSLKDAYDKGIITEKEYNAAKEKIIKQRTETDKK
ncbi:MAG: SHOCT domain-containing protein [Deltaproteobacteria bacterium]|nr:SHOCT domain-containing protein [Deltaproteobacteria bacterium]